PPPSPRSRCQRRKRAVSRCTYSRCSIRRVRGGGSPDDTGDPDAIADEVEEFLTGVRPGAEPDRVLATVLFTDIVRSSEQMAALGDKRWISLKEAHHRAVRRELERFRGREVDTAGDGF